MTTNKPEALRLADYLELAFYQSGALEAANKLRAQHNQLESLRAHVRAVHNAKGRHHTQLAMCDLFDVVGLPNERPKK